MNAGQDEGVQMEGAGSGRMVCVCVCGGGGGSFVVSSTGPDTFQQQNNSSSCKVQTGIFASQHRLA